MKYLSLMLVVFAMNWTWNLSQLSEEISDYIHVGIQEDLKSIISSYIEENLPTSRNLRFEKFWTEEMKNNQVKATFIYSFEDSNSEVGDARVEIEGYAILNREPAEEDSDYDVWSFDELYILNNKIEYKDALPVKSVPGDE